MRRWHRLAMEYARAFGRFAIDCGELILGVVFERILKTPLHLSTAVRLVFDVPSRGPPQP